MRAYDVIRKKRDGHALTRPEMEGLLAEYLAGRVPDYQMSAFLMAVFFRGMEDDEMEAWTRLMLHSGEVLDLSDVPGLKVDKHSTGGVGDKISIPLAPLAAVCGVVVPMISGRGLGHTGGTLDKLESIPGFRVDLGLDRFRRCLETLGVCMIGQTGEIAPADKRLYALRDVTATVESIPLIASSIMSKKLAEGIDGLLLDVKVGSGAFMKTEGRARELASAMLAICGKFGKRGRAYLTDMNQPLGEQVGNALEIRESIEVLKGSGPKDVTELTLEFGAAMVLMAGLEADMKAARDRVGKALFDGRALERFARMVEAQGGDPRVVDDFGLLPVGPQRSVLRADSGGWVAAIDTEGLGIASMMLGAGREKAEDCVDPSVGLTVQVKVGDRIEPGRPLVTLWHRDGDARTVEAVMRRAVAAFCMAQEPVDPPKLVLDVLQTA